MPTDHQDFLDGAAAACAPVADGSTGEVRLLAQRCSSCIFRAGNPFRSAMPDRVRSMIAEAVAAEGHVTCHSTLPGVAPADVERAICRGYADVYGHRSLAVRLATVLGTLRELPPPK